MSDDSLKEVLQKRDEHIARHEQMRSEEPFRAQTKRLQRLTGAVTFALQSSWWMTRRNSSIYDDFLTFRFFDDTIQSVVAIWSLAREGQLTPAKREMRYMLESCSKHVYIDLKKMGAPLSKKLDFLEREVPSSSVDFTKDFQLYEFSDAENKEFMNSIRSMYSTLCCYVHRSPEQIEEALKLVQLGVSPGFETAKELEGFNASLSKLYDMIIVMHFNALGMALASDVFVQVLDHEKDWPFHKTKFVKLLSSYFDYKHERQHR